ncbi:MAG TPA: hypothetical protein VF784_07805 [Anaerolineales bacterium]
MKSPLPKILFFSLVLLAIVFSGFSRILTAAAGQPSSAPEISSAAGAAAAAPTGTATALPTLKVTALVPFATAVSNPTLYAFIEAPPGALSLPYVTLTAFQSGTYAPVTISGTMNTTSFLCPGSPCTVPLQLGETRFVFYAHTSTGLTGETVYATVRAELKSDGYHVTLESVSQFARAFADSCLKEWGIQDTTGPSWAVFPPFPYQLNTQIPLHHLAARLITYGVVDTRDCPAGGLSQDMDWPNGCGLQKATPQMIVWQNQFDDAIWTAANDIGIPPKILKTLIEVESQFWPSNARFYVDEYGLGQINQLGVDILLRNDYTLYQRVCPSVLTNCMVPYVSLSPQEQASVRGALLASQNSSCASCTFGLDLTRASQSIPFIAQLVKANCDQAKAILDARSATTDYESYWKFTLLSYHSGQTCLTDALKAVKAADETVDWTHLGPMVSCAGGRKYVDNFWANLGLFDSYRYTSGAQPLVQFAPVFAPTNTPLPTATPPISSAQVVVTVYMDLNGDGTPEPGETLDGIPVQLILPDGKILSAVTSGGQAKFDMSGYLAGIQITATLPNLYRNYRFFLPQSGTVPIIFAFAQPTLPGKLP